MFLTNKSNDTQDVRNDINTQTLMPLYVIITLVGITTNLLIIVAVLKTKALRKRHSLLLLNLVTCDLVQVIVSSPYYIYSLNTYSVYKVELPIKTVFLVNLCKGYLFFSYGLGYVSILSLLLISVDRYMAVVYPFRYQIRITKGKIVLFSLLCWSLPFVFLLAAPIIPGWLDFDGRPGGFCGVQWSHVNFGFVLSNSSILFVLPTCLIFYTNIRVYNIAKKARRIITPTTVVSEVKEIVNSVTSGQQNVAEFSGEFSKSRYFVLSDISKIRKSFTIKPSLSRDIHIAVGTLLLIGCFLLTWLPFVIPRILHTFGVKIPSSVSTYTPAFAFSSVAFDPLVILCCRAEIRKAVIKLIGLFRTSPIVERSKVPSTLDNFPGYDSRIEDRAEDQ